MLTKLLKDKISLIHVVNLKALKLKLQVKECSMKEFNSMLMEISVKTRKLLRLGLIMMRIESSLISYMLWSRSYRSLLVNRYNLEREFI